MRGMSLDLRRYELPASNCSLGNDTWAMQVKQFAMTNSVHVWLVAHPRQLNAWKGSAPTLYDISGSAHFNNKADVGMVVHRDLLTGSDDKSEQPKIASEHPLANNPFACQVIIRKVNPENPSPRQCTCNNVR